MDLREPGIGGHFNINPIDVEITGRGLTIEEQTGASINAASPKSLYEIIAEFSFDWIYWISPDSTISFISPSTKFITGYSREEFLGDSSLFFNIVHPQDRLKYLKHKNDFKLDESVCSYEYRIINKNGEVRWLSHFCQAVYDEEDNYLGRYVSNRDVTAVRNIISREIQRGEEYKSCVRVFRSVLSK